MQFLSLEHLKTTLFSVLLSNPLTKDDFPFSMGRTLVHVVVVSLLKGHSTRREDLQQTVSFSTHCKQQ